MKRNHCGRPGYLVALLATLLLTTTQCKKDEEKPTTTTVRGRVLEHNSTTPVPNALVVVLECTFEFLGGSYCSIKDSTRTDADGKYSFTFPDDQRHTYLLRAVMHDTLRYTDRYDEYYIPNREVTERDIFVYPTAWLQLHIKAIQPNGVDDGIAIDGPWGGGGIADEGFRGPNQDTTIVRKVGGNYNTLIGWYIYRNYVSSPTVWDSVYTPAHDTTFYEILY